MKAIVWCFLPVLALCGQLTHAYEAKGHRVVARIANEFLSDKAKKGIASVIDSRPKFFANNFAKFSEWPLSYEKKNKAKKLTAYHRGLYDGSRAKFILNEDCLNDACIVAGINKYAQDLSKVFVLPQKRKVALAYMVHLIGDIHQPLNGGLLEDDGGIKTELVFEDKAVNLFWVWEAGLLDVYMASDSEQAYAKQLADSFNTQIVDNEQLISPVMWVEESHRYAKNLAYRFFDPNLSLEEYVKIVQPVYELRLQQAGYRLALVLNHFYERNIVSRVLKP